MSAFKYYYRYCPEGIKSRYELLVFRNNEPVNSLILFFNWLDEYSNYQGERVQWNDKPAAVRVAVEDYLKQEMHCTLAPVCLKRKLPISYNR
ncbi:MAG: hypothetical protein ABS949_11650 [Solibacillus sp.]